MISVTAIIDRDIPAWRVLHTDQNDVWVYDGYNTLTLYDEQLVEKKKTLNLTFKLSDMVLTISQDILATDYENKCVMKISPSGDVSILCSTAPLAPGGIFINNTGNIVIGLQVPWPMTNLFCTRKLVVYSSDGSTVLQEIEEDDEYGKPLFREVITQVKQNGNEDYVVAQRCRIVSVSSEGRFRWDYHAESSCWVNAIACDKYDNVIIPNLLTIILLSSEGKLVTTLLTVEIDICWPLSLSKDRHGQLWIGHAKGLKVFKYLK